MNERIEIHDGAVAEGLARRLRRLFGLRPISAARFEREYAERCGSRWTLEALREIRVVRPCDCGDEGCEGWQMVSHETATEIDDPEKPWAR